MKAADLKLGMWFQTYIKSADGVEHNHVAGTIVGLRRKGDLVTVTTVDDRGEVFSWGKNKTQIHADESDNWAAWEQGGQA